MYCVLAYNYGAKLSGRSQVLVVTCIVIINLQFTYTPNFVNCYNFSRRFFVKVPSPVVTPLLQSLTPLRTPCYVIIHDLIMRSACEAGLAVRIIPLKISQVMGGGFVINNPPARADMGGHWMAIQAQLLPRAPFSPVHS